MGRFIYKPSDFNDENKLLSEGKEIAVNVNKNYTLETYTDHKIWMNKTDYLANEMATALEMSYAMNSDMINLQKGIYSMKDRYDTCEDKIFGKYHYNYDTNEFDYEDTEHSIPPLSDKVDELTDYNTNIIQKLDYAKSVLEYNKYALDIMTKKVTRAKDRTEDVKNTLPEYINRYHDITDIITDTTFWYEDMNRVADAMYNDLHPNVFMELPNYVREFGIITIGASSQRPPTPIEVPPPPPPPKEPEIIIEEVEVDVVKYEYGFFRYFSNNANTYKSGKYKFSAAKPYNGVSEFYSAKPISVAPCNHGHAGVWNLFSPAYKQEGYLPANNWGAYTRSGDWATLPKNNKDKYFGKYTVAAVEWKEIGNSNWGKSFGTRSGVSNRARRDEYVTSLDRNSVVLYRQTVPKGNPSDHDPDSNRNWLNAGKAKQTIKFYGGNTHIQNNYGKFVRVKYRVETTVTKTITRVIG